jgi:hypothetical protein
MNIVSQKREIALQHDTAQSYLEKALTNIKPTTKQLIIIKDPIRSTDAPVSTGIDGILDFSLLQERGILSIETIYVQPHGGVTEVIHLPDTLKELDVTYQLLTGIEHLPPSLQELNLRGNFIERLDLGNLPNLKKLVASDNQLIELTNLPPSLEYIDINNNPLRSIDVATLTKLKTFLCNCPQLKRITNVTPAVKKLETNMEITTVDYSNVPDDPRRNVKAEMSEQELEDSLNDYFRLKKKYDTQAHTDRMKAYEKGSSLRAKRKLAKAVIPKCVNCERRVGSIFKHTDDRYIALCGDKVKPCDLKIKLFSGHYYSIDYMLQLFREEIDAHKETIIKQKLDTIFQYLSEEQSAQRFKEIIDAYTKDSEVYKELLDEYNELYDSPHRKGLIRAKMAQIHDLRKSIRDLLNGYVETGNTTILQTAVEQHVHELMPEMQNLQNLTYEHMDIYTSVHGAHEAFPEYYLLQSERSFAKRKSCTVEEPR